MNKKVIIFDLDDTLIQTKAGRWGILQDLAKEEYNFDLSIDVIKEHWGKPYHELMLSLLPMESDWNISAGKYEDRAENVPLEPFDGVSDTLKKLHERGQILSIITSSYRRAVERNIKVLDFTDFSFIQSSDDSTYHKPDPKVFEPTLEFFAKQGYEIDDMIYIGDWIKDYYTARDAGMDFLGIGFADENRKLFDKEGVDYITKFDEILTRLK